MKKCAIVYNPNSGKRNKNETFVNNVHKILKKYQYVANFFETKEQNDATKIVSELEDYFELVILVGGDGTINEGIAGNLQRKKKLLLGFIPMGTTNDVGAMYGYTKNYKKNLKMLLEGKKKVIDICLINEKPFIYVACIGNYVDISYATPRKLKEKYGKFAYTLYGAKKITEKLKHYEIEYEVDGKKYSGKFSFIFITNGNRVAGVKGIYNDVKLDDGMFEVALCTAKRKRELLKMLPSLFTMNIKSEKEIIYYRTNHMSITWKDNFEAWSIDGEEYKEEKRIFNFSVIREIEVLVPIKNIKKLFQ